MKSVETVWHYSSGVANILSQFRMATCSRWQISHDTTACRRTGDSRDSCCNIIANEGRKCKFVPARNGLHSFAENEQPANEVFGEHLTHMTTSWLQYFLDLR